MLDPLQMLPAPGQGALAVECRAGDLVPGPFGRLDDPVTRAQVTAERAVLAALEAGCSAPVGALAELAEGDDGEELWLRAVVLSADGVLSRAQVRSPAASRRRGRSAGALATRCSRTVPPSYDAQRADPITVRTTQPTPTEDREGDCEQRAENKTETAAATKADKRRFQRRPGTSRLEGPPWSRQLRGRWPRRPRPAYRARRRAAPRRRRRRHRDARPRRAGGRASG